MLVLIIEDEPDQRDLLGLICAKAGVKTIFPDWRRKVDLVGADVILADHNLPGAPETGCQILTRARTDAPEARRVLVTAVAHVLEDGCPAAHHLISKPYSHDEILAVLRP